MLERARKQLWLNTNLARGALSARRLGRKESRTLPSVKYPVDFSYDDSPLTKRRPA